MLNYPVGAVAAEDATSAEALERDVSDAMLDFDVTHDDVAGCDDSIDDVLGELAL